MILKPYLVLLTIQETKPISFILGSIPSMMFIVALISALPYALLSMISLISKNSKAFTLGIIGATILGVIAEFALYKWEPLVWINYAVSFPMIIPVMGAGFMLGYFSTKKQHDQSPEHGKEDNR